MECLILDLSKEIPEMCNSYKSLQELTLENCFGVNDKLVVFLKENCLALNSLCVKSCELKMQELIDIFICLPHLKSVTLNGSSISFKLKEDKNQSLPVLSELSELKLKDVQDSNIFRILMKFTNLHKIEITNLKNVDKHFKGFILQQKNMKILRTKESEIFNSLFSDSISCNFQLTCLNLVSAQTYSQNNCLNFLKFIATQNQLEDVCVTIKLGSIKEYSSYFNHVLSLKTLTAINIDSSNTCAKYFESSKVVNETVSSLKFRLHNGLQYYSSFMKKIPFIFPKLETISFEVNKNLQQISWDQEVLDGYSDSSSSDEGFQHMKENRSWQNDNCLLFANYRKSIDESSKNSLNSRSSQLSIQPLSSMMNLREIELELESSNELSLLEIEALKSCRLTIKNYSDIKRNNFKYLNSVKFVDNEHFDIFFKNHSHLKTLQVFFDVIEEYHLNGLIEELVELILQLNLEELVLSCVSEKYYTYDTAKLFEICQESESLKFVKLFGTEKKY